MAGSRSESKVGYYLMVGLAGIITVGIWQLPGGGKILWPFTLLATWAHEMGHGMAAAFFTDFHKLEIYADGGGAAQVSTVPGKSSVNALIAAAGLLGPALLGSFIILFGRNEKRSRYVLGLLAVLMGLSVAFYIRNWYGGGFIGGMAAVIMLVAMAGTDKVCFFLVQFLGLQFCINNFKDFDYMFTESFPRGGTVMLSDTGQMARNLFLPYWVWGGFVAFTSVALLVGSLWLANRANSGKK